MDWSRRWPSTSTSGLGPEILGHLDHEHAPLAAGLEVGGLALIGRARLDAVVGPDRDVQGLRAFAIEIPEEQAEAPVVVLEPALVGGRDARAALARRLERETRRRRRGRGGCGGCWPRATTTRTRRRQRAPRTEGRISESSRSISVSDGRAGVKRTGPGRIRFHARRAQTQQPLAALGAKHRQRLALTGLGQPEDVAEARVICAAPARDRRAEVCGTWKPPRRRCGGRRSAISSLPRPAEDDAVGHQCPRGHSKVVALPSLARRRRGHRGSRSGRRRSSHSPVLHHRRRLGAGAVARRRWLPPCGPAGTARCIGCRGRPASASRTIRSQSFCRA